MTIDRRDALYAQLPRLSQATHGTDHKITSEPTDGYNCVAWVDRKMDEYLDPQTCWWPKAVPTPKPYEKDLYCYVSYFEYRGFVASDSADLEPGFLKIAIYAVDGNFQHVAKPLPSGRWSSKAGALHDMWHTDLDAFDGSPMMAYAGPVMYMKREYDGEDPMTLEEHGAFAPDPPAPRTLLLP